MKLESLFNNGLCNVVLIATLLPLNVLLPGCNRFNNGTDTSATPDRVNAEVANASRGGSNGAASTGTPIGVNLSGIADWSTQLPFVDVFKTARKWDSQRGGAPFGQGGPLDLTPDGHIKSLQPGQYATTLLLDNGERYPTGQYVLLYDGQGKLEVEFAGKVVSQSPGRMVVNVVKSDAGVLIVLRETNPADPVRNIRFLMPGTEGTYKTKPFYQGFLDRLAPFKVLRFMDWEGTNGSPLKNWSERTTPNAHSQVDKGVALEYMIQLANTVHADPWFTIPHQATDDYVRQFATMVRDRLDPSLKVHIEYSNEVWNYQFEQAEYAAQQGLKQGLDRDKYTAGAKYYAKRSVEIFNIWKEVFHGNDRLIRDLAWQAVNPSWGETVLSYNDAYKSADEYAIAPYFNGGRFMEAKNLNDSLKGTPDQVIEAMQQNIRKVNEFVVANAKLARKYNLRLVAYEGGQDLSAHWVPPDKEKPLNDLFLAASRSPRMRDLYNEYLNQWKASGGGLLNQFTDVSAYVKWGHWGLLEYQDQPINTSPKYQGVMDFIKANPSK
ncbi:MAG: hypothetical protein ACAF41_28785 [Leptolyngbya sp. BL-A-14]